MEALFIDNARATAEGGVFAHYSPTTNQPVSQGAASTVADVARIVESAQKAFAAWSQTPPGQRRALLMKAADLLEGRAAEIAEIAHQETGVATMLGFYGVHAAVGAMREAAAMATQVSGETLQSDRPGVFSMTIRQPVGVCLSISPWNGAVNLAIRAIAFPLAFGNTVILKASERCPETHLRLAELLRDAGLPPGCLSVISHRAEDAAEITGALIEHPAVRRINFTGSSHVGRLLAEQAARQFKPILLELGGKSPFIVLEDANLEEAAKAAIFGAYLNHGQVCMSTERMVVHEDVADRFIEILERRLAQLPKPQTPGGDPASGCMINEQAARAVEALILDAKNKGARVIGGGERHGAFLPATLLADVTPEMQIYRHESFGPVTTVVRIASDEAAIAVANDTEYGLSSAVFTGDVGRGLAIARRLHAGMCHINGTTVQDDPNAPFGGVKASGWGRFGGKAVIDEFTELRWITIGDLPRDYPL